MHRTIPIAALIGACTLLHASPGAAHAVCGSRVYPVTLTLDDPGVADEVTIPQIVYTRAAADGGPGPGHDVSTQFEYDKRLTDEIGFAFNDDWNVNQTNNAKTQYGWDDLTVTAKWAKCLSPDHDFILGFGVIREFGHTGTTHIGSDVYGNTAPTVYFGKDLEEVSIPALQPIAVTGELSYAIADKGLKAMPAMFPMASPQFNSGNPNQVIGGLSVQYSIPFLQAQIKDYGLPEPLAHLIPLVEIGYTSSTTSPSNAPTTWTIAPGVIYLRTWYQVGLEALIPANKAAGTNVGFVVQFHVFLDDLYPHGIGAPLVDYFK
jgi:hypothetical protein